MKQAKLDKNNKPVEVEKETREIENDNNGDNNKCMSILNKITFRRGSNNKTHTESAKSKHHFYYSPELEHKLNTRYVVDGVLYAQQMHHQIQSSPLSLSPSPSPSPSVSVSINEQEADKEENKCENADKSYTKEHHKVHKRKSSDSSKKRKENNSDKSHKKGKENEEDDEEDEIELGVECVTCHTAKPARSKHCSLCKSCVRRYDHHCP